jgi:single-strand DNA-binding protein
MKLNGMGRLGRDAEVRYLSTGTPVANLSIAWNWGKKGNDGKRPVQWLDGHFYGPLVEKLKDYLKKGTEVYIDAKDVRIETFEGKSGPGYKLSASIQEIQIVGRKTEEVPF